MEFLRFSKLRGIVIVTAPIGSVNKQGSFADVGEDGYGFDAFEVEVAQAVQFLH